MNKDCVLKLFIKKILRFVFKMSQYITYKTRHQYTMPFKITSQNGVLVG